MPLLEMKSKLSQINTNFGSDTTTAGNTTSFSYDSLFKSTPPSTISIGDLFFFSSRGINMK